MFVHTFSPCDDGSLCSGSCCNKTSSPVSQLSSASDHLSYFLLRYNNCQKHAAVHISATTPGSLSVLLYYTEYRYAGTIARSQENPCPHSRKVAFRQWAEQWVVRALCSVRVQQCQLAPLKVTEGAAQLRSTQVQMLTPPREHGDKIKADIMHVFARGKVQ